MEGWLKISTKVRIFIHPIINRSQTDQTIVFLVSDPDLSLVIKGYICIAMGFSLKGPTYHQKILKIANRNCLAEV